MTDSFETPVSFQAITIVYGSFQLRKIAQTPMLTGDTWNPFALENGVAHGTDFFAISFAVDIEQLILTPNCSLFHLHSDDMKLERFIPGNVYYYNFFF